MDTFITYEGLPINSGGAHSLGKKPCDKIYSGTIEFLKKFSNTGKPKEIELIFYSSQNGSYKTIPILWRLTMTFGIPAFQKWNLGSVKQRFYCWKISQGDIDKGFEILEKYNDLPSNEYGPIVLSFKWHFHFVDFQNKRILEGQSNIPVIDERQHNSQLHLRLGQKPTISAWFAFPFNGLDEKAINYLTLLKEHLPFKPSEKHWRIWRQSSKGKWSPKVLDINAS